MTQQLVELANYFGLARVPAPPAAGDNWALAGLAETGKIRFQVGARRRAARPEAKKEEKRAVPQFSSFVTLRKG
ncbi:uncharacterized protein N7458_008774 [Penicillium daleae]|uniref:Uncharacterized protein n=1 Tax=Penicillium daleae TaxID=63821 RepID=A0AAD6BVQ8_9EURO|nr:uncharacterized protein N7458_008774 [Penicillium daleae]KAJ5437776.1 hypothetical protein N7458_008774 [Penicillium daleae]